MQQAKSTADPQEVHLGRSPSVIPGGGRRRDRTSSACTNRIIDQFHRASWPGGGEAMLCLCRRLLALMANRLPWPSKQSLRQKVPLVWADQCVSVSNLLKVSLDGAVATEEVDSSGNFSHASTLNRFRHLCGRRRRCRGCPTACESMKQVMHLFTERAELEADSFFAIKF